MHWLRTQVLRQVINFLNAVRTTCEEEKRAGCSEEESIPGSGRGKSQIRTAGDYVSLLEKSALQVQGVRTEQQRDGV